MKKYLIWLAIIFALLPIFKVHAVVTINEIMYDLKDVSDTDHEWVELYNSGTNEVSLSGWKWNDDANHNLNVPPQNGGQGTLSIDAGGYIILSGNATTFLADHPGFSGTVIDTVMSLNNTGATLSVINSIGSVVDSINYSSDMGASGDGHSLGRTDTTLLGVNDPTPGFENTNTTTETNTVSDDTLTTTPPPNNVSLGGGLPLEKTIVTPVSPVLKLVPITVKIVAPTRAFSGVPIVFSSKPTGTYNENLYKGKFIWSFGDGSSKTDVSPSEFSHTYANQGEYVVYLEYYQYSYSTKPDATDRLIIKIIQPMLALTATYLDGSVDIVNQGSQEIDLVNWKIINSTSSYLFINHVFILPKDKIHFDESLLQLDKNGKDTTLIDPSGNKIGQIKNDQFIIATMIKQEVDRKTQSIKDTQKQEQVSIYKDQTASAINAVSSKAQYFSPATLIFMSLVLLMVVVVGSIIFLWNKKDNQQTIDLSSFDIDEIN